ncbi:MAG: prepilin-type N-terminal cleavage/methylation domain-containing protein [Candidatus Omnitrophica bacterium]|nr:prepilin-type N-terminal cleavage/methylation domain-containing protein [Candidatus Omnitrophota bacterium]
MRRKTLITLKTDGFTLVELIVTMVLMGVFLFTLATMAVPVSNLWVHQSFRQNKLAEARLALLKMGRDISQIRDLQSVTTANGSALAFTDTNNAAVSYALSGSQLQRNGVILTDNISSLGFNYWDDSNSSVSVPVVSPLDTDIYRIEITLGVAAGGQSSTLRTQVRPRNLNP